MLKIIVGGQMDKTEIAEQVGKWAQGKATVDVKNDLDAVMALKNKEYDYYLGACKTGGGGALAMAIALLGMNNCLTVASPNGTITDAEIVKGVNDGKIAFGFTPEYTEQVVPIIINAILEKNNLK